jgi:hypothetical protein
MFVGVLVEWCVTAFLHRVEAQGKSIGTVPVIDQVLDLSFLRALLQNFYRNARRAD